MNPLKKIVLFFLTSTPLITSSDQCPKSKFGIVPVWPQAWTSPDKENWYQEMSEKRMEKFYS